MGAEIKLETMDRMLAELESREVANPDRVSVRKAIRLYYPKLKALADEKGCRVKDLHMLFVEMTGASLTENSFRVYWNRAGRELRAQDATTGKPAKAEASLRRDGNNPVAAEQAKQVPETEPARMERKSVPESPQAMPKKPDAGTEPVVETPKPAVPQDGRPVSQSGEAARQGGAVSQSGHVSQARTTPGFMPEGETRARSELLKKMAMEM